MEEFKDPNEKEATRHILEAYLEDVGQYYNVLSEHAIGFTFQGRAEVILRLLNMSFITEQTCAMT